MIPHQKKDKEKDHARVVEGQPTAFGWSGSTASTD